MKKNKLSIHSSCQKHEKGEFHEKGRVLSADNMIFSEIFLFRKYQWAEQSTFAHIRYNANGV